MSLSEAQKLYDYALTKLTEENKIKRISPRINLYQQVNYDYTYEIKSFRHYNGDPFNELKIINNRQLANPETIVIIDQKANGELNKIVKGDVELKKIQAAKKIRQPLARA